MKASQVLSARELKRLCDIGKTDGLDGKIIVAQAMACPTPGDIMRTQAYEPLLSGIGSSPLGDNAVDYLPVPAAPTTSYKRRYLGHLCSIICPAGYILRLVDFRQAILIGLRVQEPGGEMVAYDLEQTSPFYRFPDGNVTWYLMEVGTRTSRYLPGAGALPVNFSNDYYTADTAWLAEQDAPYLPLGVGLPPGAPYAWMSRLNSLVYPYQGSMNEQASAPFIRGGQRLGAYVSIQQTNPLRDRGPLPNPMPVPARPEDRFVNDNPGLVRYTGVSAIMLARLEKEP